MAHLQNETLMSVEPDTAIAHSGQKASGKSSMRKAALQPKAEGNKHRAETSAMAPALASETKNTRQKTVESKADAVLKRLRSAKGTTIAALSETTGWQAHSVRGFISGALGKKMGLTVASERREDGERVYSIA